MAGEIDENTGTRNVGLKRELGLFSACSLIIAIMIGSGIFVSPTGVLKHSESVGLSLIMWTISGLLSLCCALTYAELSCVVPRSGAEYAYIIEAFAPLNRYFGPILAFLCSWVNVMVIRPAETAVVILTCAEYAVEPFKPYLCSLAPEDLTRVKQLIAVMSLGIITYINMNSVKLYVKLQNVFTVCKLAACGLVVGGGIHWLFSGNTKSLHEPFKDSSLELGGLSLALYYGLWSFEGWNIAAIVAEEVKRPEVNILRSILIAVPTVTVFYVCMNFMYMSALTKEEMIASSAVAVTWAAKVLPSWLGHAIPLGVALSCFGTCLSLQFGVARYCYVAGEEGHLPRIFSFIHVEKMTPVAAVAFQFILTIMYLLAGNINVLIELCMFLMWFFYGLAMLACAILRKTKPDANRPYKVPIFVPFMVTFVAVFLAFMSIYADPSLKYLFAVLLLFVGALLYHVYVYKNASSLYFRKFALFLQSLCMVLAPEKTEN